MKKLQLAQISAVYARVLPNKWDVCAFILIYMVFTLLAQGSREMHVPLAMVAASPISLDPHHLPGYALNTVLRMLIAMCASLVFTFIYASAAAKSKRAEMVLIPILDILQSVPILGFISFTIVFFIRLFPGSEMGAECASIFAIFTSQAWNMTFSLYQSLRTIPHDLDEVSRAYRFTGWQRFWRLEVPFAMPGLIWNAMMSMSAGWFFVVASEAISIGDKTITLPGVGSYVAMAIEQRNLTAIFWAIGAMAVVILAYDQLLFRPLVAWSEKFHFEQNEVELEARSWVISLLKRTRIFQYIRPLLHRVTRLILNIRLPAKPPRKQQPAKKIGSPKSVDIAWTMLVILATCTGLWILMHYLFRHLNWHDIAIAFEFGSYTLIRVVVLITLASIIWVPIGIWVGLRPRLAAAIQPVAQFFAAFPANLFFPVAVLLIVRYDLHPDIWLSPLMILGTQWYILFNVIAGASTFPNDLKDATANFHIRGRYWWTRVMLPAVFPYYLTGAVSASGGSWNASIVAETVSWGTTTFTAQGIGSYIAQATNAGDYPRIILGISVMSLFVLLFNRLFWRRLYEFAEKRLRMD